MKIYVVDDEKNIRDIICGFLTNGGYEVQTFDNGDDLRKAFEESLSDMVILDVMMPGTDGVTICSAIRQRSNVPIMIVSAKDSELDIITGITMGAMSFCMK